MLVADYPHVISNTDTVSVLGRDEGYTVKYSPPPEGTPKGGGLNLTVYPVLNPNTGSISFLRIIMLMNPSIISLTISPYTP